MGWKSVKEYYDIKHIVQMCEGLLCIGSPYVHNLIIVDAEGNLKWGTLGPSHNDDLARYYDDMSADKAKLVELLNQPDSFKKSIYVYTYRDGQVLEKQCEELGWPNCTHDGLMMYDNSFSKRQGEIVKWAKHNLEIGIGFWKERIEAAVKELAEKKERLKADEEELKQLEKL